MYSSCLRQWLLLALHCQGAGSNPQDSSNPGLVLLQQARRLLREENASAARIQSVASLLDCLDEGCLPSLLRKRSDECLGWAAASGNKLLALADPDYPPLLANIADPPPLLFVNGDPALLSRPQLAIVGSRKPGSDGRKLASRFAANLAEAGYVITSGLALGIDAAAHEGALQAGKPTIAVLGSGLDRIYPNKHKELAARIIDNGAMVSEFAPTNFPQAWQFPRRNRIISGLSHGVLVVEAAQSSGSLITARLAAAQGREVFAVPGSIHNAMARGCHELIRNGAVLVEREEDILVELYALFQWERERCPKLHHPGELTELHARLLGVIAYNPVTVDELSLQLDLAVEQLYPELLQLELNALIEHTPAGYLRIH
jgi:DNA processing protein